MKCTKCERESDSLFHFINLSDGKESLVCIVCQVAASPELTRLEDADRMIEELTELKKSYEDLIASAGDSVAEIPPAIAAIALTPHKALKAVEAFLRNAGQDRANILDAMSESERLRLTLAEAIKREDYEEATRLKRRLEALEEGLNP